MDRRPGLVETAGFLFVLAAALMYVSAHLPSAAEYRLNADEGVYFRQALTVLHEGPRGLARLADDYLRDPAARIGPPPLRIGHLVIAAAVLAVRPSIAALSVLSLICYVLLCIVVFVFGARFWNRRIAALAGIFAAVSPLGWGLATRALMDTEHALFSALALFTLLLWLLTGRERQFVLFAVVLAWCMLVKETAWIYVPFAAAAMLWLKLSARAAVGARHIVIVAVALPAAVALVYVLAFGGPGRAIALVQAAHRANLAQPNAYLVAYGSGPWYEYVLDFLVLSPVVTLLFLFFCGREIAAPQRALATTMVLLFVGYVIAALAPVAKNPRFALPLDPLLRIGAAAMVVATAAERRSAAARAAIAIGLCAAVVLTDAHAFQQYFVKGRIYDPVAANLLSAAGSLPAAGAGAAPLPPAAAFLNLSLESYRARDFRAAIQMARQAIALEPDSAEAYNNLGAAHAELGEWDDAIAALETALRLRPDFPLARANLAWAEAGRSGKR